MTQRLAAMLSAGIAILWAPAASGQDSPKTTVMAVGELHWKGAGIPGVATSVVNGDTSKGASHFYLRYGKGLVTPMHHHSADHFVTTVAGTLVLIVGGKEHTLPPGSYFALINKEKHVARCEGAADCVMFIDARGPWDVVPAEK